MAARLVACRGLSKRYLYLLDGHLFFRPHRDGSIVLREMAFSPSVPASIQIHSPSHSQERALHRVLYFLSPSLSWIPWRSQRLALDLGNLRPVCCRRLFHPGRNPPSLRRQRGASPYDSLLDS